MYIHDKDNSNVAVTVTEDNGKNRLDVTTGLSSLPGFNIPPYDRVDATYPDTVTEVYVYENNSVVVATITATYTDDTKLYILNAVKS